ncbi:MAG TPA: recombinase family protein [Sphingomicrobium sp.]|nr:recombinase family protein [Sphingomicrobium sp.]
MIVGYARVSTSDQSLDVQEAALRSAGAEKIFAEKLSGTTSNRPQLRDAVEFCREGDTFIVTRLDRFARSSVDLHNIVAALVAKGVDFRCTEQAGVDTSTSSGKLMLGMLGAVAEFETAIRRERQMEGIARARRAGAYTGRKATIDHGEVLQLFQQGKGATEIAAQLGIGRASVYRIINAPGAGNHAGE